ncbi:5-(carboxyamino)imidazole ribonucleotide synthase [Candidatus Saccharibacteria bacterium]|nr:5-(carboxyamino)imidazole ribonucleotide synthase [Candidatus Saccharibacteria bacterium]
MGEQELHTPTIGIVGGGQLGRMLTEAALPLGINVGVVDPGVNCPAHQAGAKEITANLYDEAALRQLAKNSDYITVEIEHLDTHVLETLENEGAIINPRPATIRLIQDKYAQKVFLQEHGIPVAPFVEITDEKAALVALKDFGGSMIIKAKHGAYDGRGNMVVSSPAEVKKAFKAFADRELYAEKLVPFERELAVMVAKDMRGNVVSYPAVQTIHARNICEEVLAPAPVDESIREKAGELARSVVELLEGAGMFGVEMFLTKDGEVLVNEIAPRVHNSGHHTMEFSRTSQFEQHVRAITGLPLGSVESVVPAAVMINILGERDGPTRVTGLADVLAIPDTSVHIYGKSPTKVDRKMGHITATGKTLEEAQKRARKARKALDI